MTNQPDLPHASPGWYGKIASLGDFASRRVAPAWVETVDGWISGGLAACQKEFGPNWESAFESAPHWRFVWAPGVIDGSWWFGLILPSKDKVGRHFPLIAATSRDTPPFDSDGLDHLENWWMGLAAACLVASVGASGVEVFEQALRRLPAWPGSTTGPWANSMSTTVHFLPAARRTPDIANALAVAALLQQVEGHSLWWSTGNRRTVSPILLTFRSLPSPDEFCDLIDPGT